MDEKNEKLAPFVLAEKIIRILDSKRAKNIRLLHVEDQTVLTDYFVICSGNSNTQIKALAGEVEFQLGEAGLPPFHIDGYNEGTWVALDFGAVIVHIFSRETRDFYNLEKLWGDSEEVDIKDILVTEE